MHPMAIAYMNEKGGRKEGKLGDRQQLRNAQIAQRNVVCKHNDKEPAFEIIQCVNQTPAIDQHGEDTYNIQVSPANWGLQYNAWRILSVQ